MCALLKYHCRKHVFQAVGMGALLEGLEENSLFYNLVVHCDIAASLFVDVLGRE